MRIDPWSGGLRSPRPGSRRLGSRLICTAKARTTPAELRQHGSRDIGHGHIVDSMTGAARYFGGGGDDSLAARRRREKLYAGTRRHHGVAAGIAREGKGAVRKR